MIRNELAKDPSETNCPPGSLSMDTFRVECLAQAILTASYAATDLKREDGNKQKHAAQNLIVKCVHFHALDGIVHILITSTCKANKEHVSVTGYWFSSYFVFPFINYELCNLFFYYSFR